MAYPTPRARSVVATGQDQHGERLVIAGTGLLARALQHETDHLDGRLYIDTLRGDVRRQALRELRAIRPAPADAGRDPAV
jgi:peptide deformylase